MDIQRGGQAVTGLFQGQFFLHLHDVAVDEAEDRLFAVEFLAVEAGIEVHKFAAQHQSQHFGFMDDDDRFQIRGGGEEVADLPYLGAGLHRNRGLISDLHGRGLRPPRSSAFLF